LAVLLPLLIACDETSAVDAGTPAPGDAGFDAGVERPTAPVLPVATGACPDFLSSETVTLSPAGIEPRSVRVWISDQAETLDGPVIFFWHGAGGSAGDAQYAFSAGQIDAVLEQGGVVVSPSSDPGAGDFPWYLTVGSADDDLRVMDDAVACLDEQVGIDATHIHSLGFSAGALHNSQVAVRRASYVASVATYSGGLITRRTPPTDAPGARFAALLFHGGPGDIVITNFMDATETYRDVLTRQGHYVVVCAHGGGHTIPNQGPEQVMRFFEDHPFGVSPFPYSAGALPDVFGAECAAAN